MSGQSLFTTQTPALPSASDGVAYEVGMKFRAARAGAITALRFWKAANDTGTHTGRLWSASGTLLASVTFSNETASGWQQQPLPAAVPIQANTTYVVSANIGSRYPFTSGGLASSIVNGDLSSVADGNNGVFGKAGVFPTQSFNNSNYFRDVVFVPDAAAAAATKLALTSASTITSKALPVTFTARVQDANGTGPSGRDISMSPRNQLSLSGGVARLRKPSKIAETSSRWWSTVDARLRGSHFSGRTPWRLRLRL